MTAPYTIRRAVAGDAEAIAAIWLEGLAHNMVRVEEKPTIDTARAAFAERLQLAQEPFGVWVALGEGGAPVGWQSLLPCVNNPLVRGRCAESSTYVLPLASHSGVGEALLRHAMKEAKAARFQHLLGWIINPRALRLVERCGWSQVGKLPESGRVREDERWHLVAWAVPQE
jgi:L-amino acid N-acyltransferase YncA